jgi:signal transduction histidine kinase
MLVRGVPVFGADGDVREWVGTHTDVTERVMADADRERLFRAAEAARADAEAANAAKTHFLSAMSHELRTPLTAIGGYTQLIDMGLHGSVTPAQQQALGRITRAQQHLLTLINDILSFAKLEAGQAQLEIGEVDVDELCARIEPLVGPQAAAKGVAFAWHAAVGRGEGRAPLRARADRGRVLQIMVNLVTNAVKYTDAGGGVSVESAAAGDWVAISVRDTGRGIPTHMLGAVFEPFVQVAPEAASREGVGLGLAISRDLARKMGGDITAESELGVGSTFTLRLPAGFP